MRRIRKRISKPASAIAVVVGICFTAFGIYTSIVIWFNPFFVVWTLVAFAITVYHAANIFARDGVAGEILEIDGGTTESPTVEERLQKLDSLLAKGLIDEREYQEQRKRILGAL